MKFHDHRPRFRDSRPYDEILRKMEADLKFGPKQSGIHYAQPMCEAPWVKQGCPYVCVWPDMAELLAESSLEIPSRFLDVPFGAILIRLSEDSTLIRDDDGRVVCSLLVTIKRGPDEKLLDMLAIYKGGGTWWRMRLSGDTTLGELIESITAEPKDLPFSDWTVDFHPWMKTALSLAMSTCLLMCNSDRLVTPDPLAKDLRAYLDAVRQGDADRIKVIIDRAHRRGKRGHTVKADEQLRNVLRPQRNSPDDGADGEKHSLHFAHLRRGHFRRLATDAITWIRPCVVRPDLPPSTRRPGYALRGGANAVAAAH